MSTGPNTALSPEKKYRLITMRQLFISIFVVAISFNAIAQFPTLSPAGKVEQQIGSTTIKIAYERPAARGRKIFGSLVPYEQVWRTGAGKCTKIYFDKPVVIGATAIAEGAYSLFTIPGLKNWTIILNKDTALFGSDGYSESKDVVRLNAPVQSTTRFYESMTIDIDVIPNNGMVYISWENVQVTFLVDTQTDKKAQDHIKTILLTKQSKDADDYATAAEYLYYMGTDLETGDKLIAHAITLKKQLWYYRLRLDILERLKNSQRASEVADEAIGWISMKEDWSKEKREEYRKNFEKRKGKLSGK